MSTSEPKFGAIASSVVNVGDVLGGKYRVEKVIGEGGMGVVVSATHLHLDEKVAIKMLLPDALKSPDIVGRFLREARAAVKIKSEHVARVTDVGTLENGAPFMVMEYLAGSDLSDVLQNSGPVSADVAMDYVLQASEAIAEAHSLGIVHRDLKPANLFLIRRADGSPCIKVLDFGISKINDGSHSRTKTSAVMGSPAYMSPEQMRSSRNVDCRTDIWALGAIMFELLAGAPPFDADTVPQLCMKIMTEPLPPLRGMRPEVPVPVEAVINRCQEKDPGRRFQHMGELAEALAPLVMGRARLSAERIIDIAASAQLRQFVSSELTTEGAQFRTSSSMPPPVSTQHLPPTGGFANAATVATDAAVTTGNSPSGSWGTPAPAPKKSNSALLAGVAIAALVCGGAGFFMLRASNKPLPSTNGQAAAATAGVELAPPQSPPGPLSPVVTVSSDPIPSAAPSASAAPNPSNTAVAASSSIVPKGPAVKTTAAKPTNTAAPQTKKPGGGLFDDRN